MADFTNIVDETFRRERIRGVERILRRSIALPVPSTNNPFEIENSLNDGVEARKLTQFTHDRGNGRISKGIQALKILSKMAKGIDPSRLRMFGGTLYSGSLHELEASSTDRLIEIISVNLGINEYMIMAESVNKLEVEKTKQYFLRLARSIRAGTFVPDSERTLIMARCKKIVELAANRKVI